MAPQRKVINQGTTKTIRGGLCDDDSAVSCRRASSVPSRRIATSTRRADARFELNIAHTVAAAAKDAVDHTLSGCLGSARRAAASKAALVSAAAATAASQSRRSRAEGRRTVQPRITQSRLKTRVPFVPPKPNEFFRATSTFMSRAVLAQ